MSKEEHVPSKVINEPKVKDSNSGSKIKVLLSMREIVERKPIKQNKPFPSPSRPKEETVEPKASININDLNNSTTRRSKLTNGSKLSKNRLDITKNSFKSLNNSAFSTSIKKESIDNSKNKLASSTLEETMSGTPVNTSYDMPVQSTDVVQLSNKEVPVNFNSSIQEIKLLKYSKKSKKKRKESKDIRTPVVKTKSGFRVLDFAIVGTLFILLATTIYLILCTSGIVCGNTSTGCTKLPPKISSNGKLVEPSTNREPVKNSYPPYSSLMYVCDEKYELKPNRDISVCREDGTWTHTQPPECVLEYLDCQQKPGLNPPKPYGEEIVDEINISCDYTNGGGGWIMILKRSNGEVDFEKTFAEYENLVGSTEGDHWLGLKNIYQLTSKKNYELRVDLWDFENGHRFAQYSSFNIGSAPDYKLSVSGYSGNAGW